MAEPTRRRRLTAWLAWWIVLMSLWVALDDSFASDELIAGAAAAAAAALVAEVVGHQAGTRYQVRPSWLLRALSLPASLVTDTAAVFGVLAAVVLRKAAPPGTSRAGTYREVPVQYGDDSPAGVTRRVLLTAARSFTPNGFVVELDPDRDVMLVHELVSPR